jgi:hypothetical protein
VRWAGDCRVRAVSRQDSVGTVTAEGVAHVQPNGRRLREKKKAVMQKR